MLNNNINTEEHKINLTEKVLTRVCFKKNPLLIYFVAEA